MTNRAQLFASIDGAMKHGASIAKDRKAGQSGLFEETEEESFPELPDVQDWSFSERLAYEKEVLGIYVSGHPLDLWDVECREWPTHYVKNIEAAPESCPITLVAIFSEIQIKKNASGKNWADLKIDDKTSLCSGKIFAGRYAEMEPFVAEGLPILIRATVRHENDSFSFLAIDEIARAVDRFTFNVLQISSSQSA